MNVDLFEMLISNHLATYKQLGKLTNARLLLVAIIIALNVGMSTNAFATIKIVAEVNGSVITNYQVEHRAAFLRMIWNVEDTEDNRAQIYNDARQMLIDEVIKLEAAKSVDPSIESRVREAARQLVNENFAENGKDGIQVLREHGIDAENIQDKFITDLSWNEFIKFKFSNKFNNLKDSVNNSLKRLEENAKQPQIKLSEIVLMPEPNRPLAATLKLANEIIRAVNRGADFNVIAQQYSAAGTANKGGRLGWIMLDQLPDEIRKIANETPMGSISKPLQRDGVVILVRKEGTMVDGVADPRQDIITLARATILLGQTTSNADKLEAAARLERDTNNINSCDEIAELNQSYKSPVPSFVKNIPISSLNAQLQAKIEGMTINKPSAPVAFAEGISVIMLCSRVKPQIKLPSLDDLYRVEFDKVFGTLSERYLLRLRRTAIIEIK
jgi:peptidyl-prolyl cis-trans isomerase SurA